MKTVKKGSQGEAGGVRRARGGPRGIWGGPGEVPGGSGGLPENGHFLFFGRWILHTSNEILMFSIWGRFRNRSVASQVLLFFYDFSRYVFCKSMRWKQWKSVCFFDTFPFRMFEMLWQNDVEKLIFGGEFWGLGGVILMVKPMVF